MREGGGVEDFCAKNGERERGGGIFGIRVRVQRERGVGGCVLQAFDERTRGRVFIVRLGY